MICAEIFKTWGVLFVSAIFNAYGAFIIKCNINRLGAMPVSSPVAIMKYFLRLLMSWQVATGLVFFFLSPVLLIIALSRMDVSLAQPAWVALNVFIITTASIVFLKEKMDTKKVIGICLLITGLFLLNA